jgi:hypothetical protein
MDLKVYYQKIRGKEAEISEEFPIVVSKETQDGGREGRYAEVTRAVAAKMLTDGTARLATADESKAYREAQASAKKAADDAAEAAKVQFTLVPSSEMAKLTTSKKEKA